ncbi:hypothetical protein [Cellvibrio sp. PSBB006]|uniref:hypothetical protein n=1 Tax=Cellvibrio sp. PSBB006 TaxID=1987723 RepID=UPI0012FC0F07|nr:hypothetical protein [Cellvibrio sp. PSBB006]
MIILDHISWADHGGDLSWNERVLISDLLPTAGTDVAYSSRIPLPEAYVSFLWVPPHSEYNGFFDRPYEFVKARLISGKNIALINKDEKVYKYKFTVDKVETISDVINHFKYVRRVYIREGDKDRIESWRKSFFPKEILQISDWNWAYIGHCDFLGGGNLIYVNERDCEYNYDVFILEKNGDYFSVFELTTVAGNTFSEPINVKLSEEEGRSLEILMKSIDPLDCSKRYLYDNNEVQGAEWR